MMTFWIITLLMIAVAIAFIAPALLRKQHTNESKAYRDGQNVSIAREHLADLDEELANDTLTQALYDQSKLEIEQTLLFDLEEQGTVAQQASDSSPGKMGFIAVLIAVPLITVLLYLQLGTPELIDAAKTHNSGQLPDIDKLTANLRQRLQQNPDDAEGWYMLGRTLMTMKQYSAAIEAYENTNRLLSDRPNIMLSLANAIAMAQGGSIDGRPARLILDVIAIDPNNTTGLWMAGIIAEEEGQDKQALDLWLRLRPLLVDRPDELVQLDSFINRVAGRLDKDRSGLLPNPTATDTATGVGLTIQLAEDLYSRVNGEETVFIYARAMQGSRAPVAVIRYQVKDLPLSITLDDSHAVMSSLKLSDFKEVQIEARVSYSGNAITQSGDLMGQVKNVMVGQASVTVIINEIAP